MYRDGDSPNRISRRIPGPEEIRALRRAAGDDPAPVDGAVEIPLRDHADVLPLLKNYYLIN